jgi:hypothetical protein
MPICTFSTADSSIISRSQTRVDGTWSGYGVHVKFETDPELAKYIPTPLIPGGQIRAQSAAPVVFRFERAQLPTGAPIFAIRENGIQLQSSPNATMAARALESHIHQYVAEFATDFVFVHAGVVAFRNKAILVPGASHSGKTTLIMALVKAGGTYYSDEYAVFDRHGLVHPFARLPRLRPDVLTSDFSVIDYAASNDLPPLSLGLVLNTRYSPDAVWRPRTLTSGETLLALVENTVAVRRQAELTIRVLKNAVMPAIGLQSERPEAAITADHLLNLIDEIWEVIPAENQV